MTTVSTAVLILIMAGSMMGGGVAIGILAIIAYWWMNGKSS